MRFLFYTHSLISDWNHGNAHFLRGVMRALQKQGHQTQALEPEGAWSRDNLLADRGQAAVDEFHADFPDLKSEIYGSDHDHASACDAADVVVVHEWTDPALVARIGRMRAEGGRFTLLFHDTHHRAVTAEGEIGGMDLSNFDGVLAFGDALRQRYLAAGWGRQVFVWHEAADVSVFRPMPEIEPTGDLIWIGNWGDGERSAELMQFLVRPVANLGLTATVHGVRYPDNALAALAEAGIAYRGSIANAHAPQAFAQHRVTVHVPRQPYVQALPGIPTIRPFEALACGIPLISAPWDDVEHLFRDGDFLWARDGAEMEAQLSRVLSDSELSADLSRRGLETIHARHTCDHRASELLQIVRQLGATERKEAMA